MDENSESNSFFSDMHASMNEEIGTLTSDKLVQLVKDKEKAKHYIKNCKTIMKKQSEQLKLQQREHKKSVSAVETQSFTTKFHAVAFRLELEVMKLIGIRRSLDTTFLKKYFRRFANKVKEDREGQVSASRVRLLDLKCACLTVWNFLKKEHRFVKSIGFERIHASSTHNNDLKIKETLRRLKSEKQMLEDKEITSSKDSKLEALVIDNKNLKEKLKNTEQSVAVFIKEMGVLLDKNEPPTSPKAPAKKRGKNRNRNSMISGDRKFKNFLVQFG